MSTNPANMTDHELLTATEEAELAAAVHAGAAARHALRGTLPVADRRRLEAFVRAGDAARDRFVQSNVRLVVAYAARSRPARMSLDDAIQDGNVGLLRAVDRFDPSAGCRFATYAMFYVRQAIFRGADDTGRSLRLSHTASELLTRVQRALNENPAATVEDLADPLDLPADQVADLLRAQRPATSLSAEASHDPVDPSTDPEPIVQAAAVAAEVAAEITSLPGAERDVVLRRFGLLGHHVASLSDVAAALGLSRAEAAELELAAYQALRTSGLVAVHGA